MMEPATGELRTRMDITAQTIHPTAQLVDGAKRRYGRRRTAGVVLATGAAVAVLGAAVTVPAILSHRPADGSRVVIAEPPPAAAQPAPEQTWTVTMSSGLTFTLPAGFRATHIGPVRTKLGPDEPDVNDLTGYSMVTSAESDTPGQEITLATYEGDVGAFGNEQVSRPDYFGRDPVRRTSIAGHDAWISTVTEIHSPCIIALPGQPKRDAKRATGVACGGQLPYVTIEVNVGPQLHLYLNSSKVSEAEMIAVAESGLT